MSNAIIRFCLKTFRQLNSKFHNFSTQLNVGIHFKQTWCQLTCLHTQRAHKNETLFSVHRINGVAQSFLRFIVDIVVRLEIVIWLVFRNMIEVVHSPKSTLSSTVFLQASEQLVKNWLKLFARVTATFEKKMEQIFHVHFTIVNTLCTVTKTLLRYCTTYTKSVMQI